MEMNDELKQKLLVTYGFLMGLNGKPIGSGTFGGIERLYIPQEVISPLKELLFPGELKDLAKEERK